MNERILSPAVLRNIAATLQENAQYLRTRGRPEHALVAEIVAHSARTVGIAARTIGDGSEIEALAWAARRIFETVVTVRYVLADSGRYLSFRRSQLLEHSQVARALIKIGEQAGISSGEMLDLAAKAEMQAEDLKARFGSATIPGFHQMAKDVGLETEYVRFYRILSKLTHPSPWLIGAPVEPLQEALKLTVTNRAVLYALDLRGAILDPRRCAERRFDPEISRWLGP